MVERCKGRVVKTIGDEVMCVFRRADDAVVAASEMQAQVDANRPGKYHVQIHIGLHYGPVLVEDNDVFGDTVNAAAYLTAVAAAEQILTTEATERNLSPELKTNVRPVFKAVLKGSTDESTVYQVVWHKDVADLTDVNMRSHRMIPGDRGSLIIAHRNFKPAARPGAAQYHHRPRRGLRSGGAREARIAQACECPPHAHAFLPGRSQPERHVRVARKRRRSARAAQGTPARRLRHS